MGILKELLSAADWSAPVRRVSLGCFFAAVSTRATGLASVLRPPRALHRDDPMPLAGRLADLEPEDLGRLVLSDRPLEASVGLAALNSTWSPDLSRAQPINAAEILAERSQDRRVVVVGGFPFSKRLRKLARWVEVFELDPLPGSHERPADEVFDYLPAADVVVLSATTLMNRTFEPLAAALPKDAFVMMVGPSTPLHPLLFDWGLDALAGSVVTDEQACYRTLTQGATFRNLAGVRKWTLLRG